MTRILCSGIRQVFQIARGWSAWMAFLVAFLGTAPASAASRNANAALLSLLLFLGLSGGALWGQKPAETKPPQLDRAPAFTGGPSNPLAGEDIETRYLQAQGFVTPADLRALETQISSSSGGRAARLPRLFKDMYFEAKRGQDGGALTYQFQNSNLPTLREGDFLWQGDFDSGITVHRVTGARRVKNVLKVDTVPLEGKDLLKNMRFDLQEHFRNEPLPLFEKMEYPDGKVTKWTSDDALLRVSMDPNLHPSLEGPARRPHALAEGAQTENALAYGGSETMNLDLIDQTNLELYDGQKTALYSVDAFGTPVDIVCGGHLSIIARKLYLNYTPTLKFSFDTTNGAVLQKANAELSGTLDFKAVIKVSAEGGCNLLYRRKPWTYTRAFAVWIVPMVAYLEVYPIVEVSSAASGWIQAGLQRQLTHKFGYNFDQTNGWQGYKCDDGSWKCSDTGYTKYNPASLTDGDPTGNNNPMWSFGGQILAELRMEPHAGVYVVGKYGPRLIPTPSLRFNAHFTAGSTTDYDYGLYGCLNTKFEFTFKGIFDNCSNSSGVREQLYSGLELEKGTLLSTKVVHYPGEAIPTGQDYSLRWSGMVEPQFTGAYTFYANTKNGVRLWVDGKGLIDDWNEGGQKERTASINLEAGQKYSLKMENFNKAADSPNAALWWSATGLVKQLVPQGRFYPCEPFYTKTLFDTCYKLVFQKKQGTNPPAEDPCANNSLNPDECTPVVGTPELISPIEGAFTNSLRPTFTWKAASNAELYQIAIGNKTVDGITGTSYTPTEDLRPQVRSTWKVRGYRTSNPKRTGLWSEERKIDVGINISSGKTFYGHLDVGNTVTVYDPRIKAERTFWLYDIDNNTPRQLKLRYTNNGSWVDQVVPINTAVVPAGDVGLFIYPVTIYCASSDCTNASTARFSELMIAPYFTPELQILSPQGGAMSGALVTVSATYMGQDVPWVTGGNPPIATTASPFRTLCYCPSDVAPCTSSCSANTTYTWSMTGNDGSRTLTVTLTDLKGQTISRSVTVNYDHTLPFWAYVGPLGDTWTGMSLGTGGRTYESVGVYLNLWWNWDGTNDAYDRHCGGEFAAFSRQEVIDNTASAIAGCMGYMGIPNTSTGVFVVDKTQYDSGTLSVASPYNSPNTYYKEIYNALAARLGKDSLGNYRVWTSTSAATRTVADAIKDAVPPTVTITAPAIVNSTSVTLSGTATDDYQLSKVEYGVTTDGSLPATWTPLWTGSMATATWSQSISLTVNKVNTISVRATEATAYGKQTVASVAVICDTAPPSIGFSWPETNDTLHCATTFVIGAASDANGIQQVEVRVNGGPWLLASGTTSWASSVNLSPGTNTITARVTDSAGNSASSAMTIQYSTTGGSQYDAGYPLPAPSSNSFTNEGYLRDSNMETYATSVGGSVIFNLGAPQLSSLGAVFSNSGAVSLSGSLDGSTYYTIASASSSGGFAQVSGIAYCQYLKIEASSGIKIYEVRIGRDLGLSLPTPSSNSFTNEPQVRDGNFTTSASIYWHLQSQGLTSGSATYNFGSPILMNVAALFDFSCHSWTTDCTSRPNSGTLVFEASMDGATWSQFATATSATNGYGGGGPLTLTSGTAYGQYLRIRASETITTCSSQFWTKMQIYEVRVKFGQLGAIPSPASNSFTNEPQVRDGNLTTSASIYWHLQSQGLTSGSATYNFGSPILMNVAALFDFSCHSWTTDCTSRPNSGTLVFEASMDGATWSQFATATSATNGYGGGGPLTLTSGTAYGQYLRISASETITTCGSQFWTKMQIYEVTVNGLCALPAADTTPPNLSIASPANNTVFANPAVTLDGNVSDGGGVWGVHVSLNGGAYEAATINSYGGTPWSKALTLAPGGNSVDVRAFDATGNMSTAHLDLIYDAEAPTIRIDSPDSNSIALSTPLTVSGAASDNVQVAAVDVRVNGGAWTAATGTFAWTKSVALVAGTNRIEARVTDGVGNTSTTAITVPYGLPINAGLLGYWRMDDSEQDSSGYNHHGALNGYAGTTPRWTTGLMGKALSFDGTSTTLSVPDDSQLRLTGDLTLSAWVKITSFPGVESPWVRVAGKGAPDYRNYGLWYNGTGQVLFQIGNAGGTLYANAGTIWGTVSNAATLQTGQWYLLTGKKEGSTIYVYVNSTLVATAPIAFTPATTSDAFTLGRLDPYAFHNGLIDEVRLYNRALTATEITTLHGLYPSPGTETVLNQPGHYKGYFANWCSGTYAFVPAAGWYVTSCSPAGVGTHGVCGSCAAALVDVIAMTNIAYLTSGGTITADSGYASGTTPEMTVDGSTVTSLYYQSDATKNITRDFGRSVYIDKVRFQANSSGQCVNGNGPRLYVKVSTDGTTWVDKGNACEDVCNSLASSPWISVGGSYRYVRIYKENGGWWTLDELEIQGVAN